MNIIEAVRRHSSPAGPSTFAEVAAGRAAFTLLAAMLAAALIVLAGCVADECSIPRTTTTRVRLEGLRRLSERWPSCLAGEARSLQPAVDEAQLETGAPQAHVPRHMGSMKRPAAERQGITGVEHAPHERGRFVARPDGGIGQLLRREQRRQRRLDPFDARGIDAAVGQREPAGEDR